MLVAQTMVASSWAQQGQPCKVWANPSEFEFRALLYGTWSWAVLDYDSNVSPVAPRSPVLWLCVTYTAHAHVSMSASL